MPLLFFLHLRFTVAMIYFGSYLNASNLGGSIYLNTIFCSLAEIFGELVLFFTINWLGRRHPHAWSLFTAGVLLLCILAVPQGLYFKMCYCICSTFLFDVICALIVIQYTSQSSGKIVYNTAIDNISSTVSQIQKRCYNGKTCEHFS